MVAGCWMYSSTTSDFLLFYGYKISWKLTPIVLFSFFLCSISNVDAGRVR